MDFEKDIKMKLEQNDFAKNNGRILRTINVLSGKFVEISLIKAALKQYMSLCEFDESLVYIHKACYIEVRCKHNTKIATYLDKYSHDDLEAALTQKGIKLVRGFIVDEAVDI